MKTQTLSFLKQHAANLPLEDEPLQITQHGIPVYRIYSEQQAQMMDESLALLKIANLAERDIREGNVMSVDDVLSNIQDK